MTLGSPVARVPLVALLWAALAACDRSALPAPAPILVFVGGASAGDVDAVEHILDVNHLAYAIATSEQLNRMTVPQLAAYRLMIVPGGNFLDMGASLTPRTASAVHDAVQGGLSYLGICAGAFVAGDGRGSYRAFNLTSGARFGFYGAERQGIRKAPVVVTVAGGRPMEQYWEDGPELTGWGDVVARYPDGTPAIAEGMSGRGWVILVGTHPEAPESWRRGMPFSSAASVANAYAVTLIQSALTRTPMPHY